MDKHIKNCKKNNSSTLFNQGNQELKKVVKLLRSFRILFLFFIKFLN